MCTVSCGGSDAIDDDAKPSDGTDAGPVVTTVDAACPVTITRPPLVDSPHVPVGTVVDYNSNPPTSGAHYPVWAAYKTFSTPVPRSYYVHNLEHGGLVFLYKCAEGSGCSSVVSAFESVIASLSDDPICTPPVRVRATITPDPLIDVPIALAAWGWMYKADCIDIPSLTAFAKAHYGEGKETLCTDGQENF